MLVNSVIEDSMLIKIKIVQNCQLTVLSQLLKEIVLNVMLDIMSILEHNVACYKKIALQQILTEIVQHVIQVSNL